jgi:hypothetical protein
MANKVLAASEETETLATHHRRIMKFVRKEITEKRCELFKQREKTEEPDRKLQYDAEAKRTLAFEKMVLSLSLIMCIPNDLD